MKSQVGSEFLGTLFLLLIVVGSGIMGEKLSPENAAVALLANSIATGTGLYVLILALGPISGAHFNPVVSLISRLNREISNRTLILYTLAQTSGAVIGVWITHFIYDLPILQISLKDRATLPLGVSEIIATFGLVSLILILGRSPKVASIPAAVAAYITSAYWFTSSTSFANPAVTLARSLTDTFSGIAPNGIPLFIGAQLAGALIAYGLFLSFESTRSSHASK